MLGELRLEHVVGHVEPAERPRDGALVEALLDRVEDDRLDGVGDAASRAAKISQGYLHKLEAGNVENPSPRVLQRLSEALGVSYGRLMQLADYLLPGEATSPASKRGPRQEDDMTANTATQAAPTNNELARLLEAVLRELAELRRNQDELARSLTRLTGCQE